MVTNNENKNNSELAGKAVLITGGASGIGEAISKKFAASGAVVHILEINIEQAVTVVEEINNSGGQAQFHQCDVAVQSEVQKIVDQISSKVAIDILVNNAGVAHVGTAESTNEEDFDRLYQINIKGVYNCLHSVIPHMKKNRHGVILNMASIASCVGIADRFAYSMTKGAVLTMTYSVAKDFLADNIRCNCVSPARIHTPFVDGFVAKNYPGREAETFEKLAKSQPIGRMGLPLEVAELALFLCSDKAAFITGTNYPIDGGFITLNG